MGLLHLAPSKCSLTPGAARVFRSPLFSVDGARTYMHPRAHTRAHARAHTLNYTHKPHIHAHLCAHTQALWLGSKIEEELTRAGKRLCKVRIDKKERTTVEGMLDGVRLLRQGAARRGRVRDAYVCTHVRPRKQVRLSRHFLLFLTREVRSLAVPDTSIPIISTPYCKQSTFVPAEGAARGSANADRYCPS